MSYDKSYPLPNSHDSANPVASTSLPYYAIGNMETTIAPNSYCPTTGEDNGHISSGTRFSTYPW